MHNISIVIAYYSLTKTIIMNELTMYEDKLAYVYRKRSHSLQPCFVVYKA